MPRISARKNWRVFSLVLSQIAEYKERIVIAFACLLLARLMFVAMPFVLKHVVDNLANLGTSSGKIFATATLSLVFLYATIRLINVLLDEIRENLFGRVTERIACLVNSFSFQHLHALDLSFHLNRSTGAIFREIQRGTTGIETLLQYSTFNIIPTIIEIILIFFIFSFNYGITFATIVLISVLLFTITSILASEWNSRFMRKVNETESAISNSAIESLLNYETIKYFTNEYFESKRYEEKLRAWERSKGRQRLALSRTVSLQALIVSISIAITLSISVVGVFEGNLEIGDFVLINAFMMQIFIPLNYLGFIYKESKNSMVDIENLLNLLSINPKINHGESKNNFSRCETKIEFRNVSFRYHNGREILKSVSFTIKRGEKVAIVGESGAGKSTIAKLLFRFFDCDSGCIEIDGKNIKDLDIESLRGQIGVVPQDIVLFNNSIVENVRYGRPSANLEEIENAIELSGLSQLVSILPNGQHTIVGERGLKLSGGEKQRLGIARAILKRPSIWVFDEATSSLDSESESLMNKSISQVSRADLNLVISHRLSAVVDADKILVLAGGRMVEEGDHQSLLQSDGIYARIWKHQQDLQLMTK